MTARNDAFQLLKARDEVRVSDVAAILDYLEAVAGTSNAAARANALAIRDRHQLSSSDMGRFYDYVDLLGTTLALTKTQFLNRRMRDRDFTSRRHIDYMYDLIDSAFGGTYAAAVLKDMSILGGSLFEFQSDASPTPDTGPNGVTDMTVSSPPPEVAGPFAVAPGNVSLSNGVSGWVEDYESTTMATTFGASEDATIEFWANPAHVAGGIIVTNPGANPLIFMEGSSTTFRFQGRAVAIADPGAWVANTAYAQGDRRRPTVNNSQVYEVEVAGTSAAISAGSQEVDVGGAITGGSATGLANDATVYTATVTVDGGGDAISIVGSAAQTYTTLITELDADTTGGTWSLIGGNLVCTSSTTGESSTIAITDTDLFLTLTDFVAINAAVPGDGEPTFPTLQGTVVDGTVTWRHVSHVTEFHSFADFQGGSSGGELGPNVPLTVGEWQHIVLVKDSTGVHLYKNGVLGDEVLIPAPNTIPGSFGTPVRWAYDTADWDNPATAVLIGAGSGGSLGFRGGLAYMAIYDGALTADQILTHYNSAVEQGLA